MNIWYRMATAMWDAIIAGLALLGAYAFGAMLINKAQRHKALPALGLLLFVALVYAVIVGLGVRVVVGP